MIHEALSYHGAAPYLHYTESSVLLAFSFWLMAFGLWLMAFGFWLLAFGFWLLAFGFWLLARCARVVFGFLNLQWHLFCLEQPEAQEFTQQPPHLPYLI